MKMVEASDDIGHYADVDIGGISQRMRWIKPGRFMMGSPNNEPGRWAEEGPQHDVWLSKGFWLFDAPVTQALWTAVMGKNPSRFSDPLRPAEQVSGEDVAKFFERANSLVPGLELVLPTEAQ